MIEHKVVRHNGTEYTIPDFEAWVTGKYGAHADYELVEMSTWNDLIQGTQVFVLHRVLGDRGDNGRFSKLHTTETTNT